MSAAEISVADRGSLCCSRWPRIRLTRVGLVSVLGAFAEEALAEEALADGALAEEAFAEEALAALFLASGAFALVEAAFLGLLCRGSAVA